MNERQRALERLYVAVSALRQRGRWRTDEGHDVEWTDLPLPFREAYHRTTHALGQEERAS